MSIAMMAASLLFLTLAAPCPPAGPAPFEAVPSDQVQKFAPVLLTLLKEQVAEPPVTVEAWTEKALVYHGGASAAVALVPDRRFTAEQLGRLSDQPSPVGIVLLLNLNLLDGARPLRQKDLVTIGIGGEQGRIAVLYLAARKRGDAAELVVYSKTKTALATIPLRKGAVAGAEPFALRFAQKKDEKGVGVTAVLPSGYEATLNLAPPQEKAP